MPKGYGYKATSDGGLVSPPLALGGRRGWGGGTRKSIKNPATYEALKRCGYDKRTAAMISNGILLRGVKRGVHRGKSRC